MAGQSQTQPLYTVIGVTDQQLYDEDHRPIAGRRVLWQLADGAKFSEDFPADGFTAEHVAETLDAKAGELAKVRMIEGPPIIQDESGKFTIAG